MQKNPRTFLVVAGIAAAVAAVGGVVIFSSRAQTEQQPQRQAQEDAAPKTENGKQILAITAKGGYAPELIEAKADMPAIIRVTTDNTFDCSSTLVIRDLDYRARLPVTGVTDIDVPPQKAGTEINGSCGMGMYSFTIRFKA